MKTMRQIATPILLACVLVLGACNRDETLVSDVQPNALTNLVMSVNSNLATTRGGGPDRNEPLSEEVVNGLQLYRFSNATPPIYAAPISVRERGAAKVHSVLPEGTWQVAMNYFRTKVSERIAPPTGAVSTVGMDDMLLYAYRDPSATPPVGGVHESAAEIFTSLQKVQIDRDVINTANAHLTRNVAMVELMISHAEGRFVTGQADAHIVSLHHVPKKLSYGGKLLKTVAENVYQVSTTEPDTLSQPLRGYLTLTQHTDPVTGNYLKSDIVRFIIPAHKGNDFWTVDADGKINGVNNNSTDILQLKMKVSIDLKYTTGGRNYSRTVEIPVTTRAGKVLRVNLKVIDGVQVATSVLDWNYIEIDENVGAPKSPWIYVKQGSTGAGFSWDDAVGTIVDGIKLAQKLKEAGHTIHGVLIAGGPTREYSESITISEGVGGIRLFGGWEGVPGTELTEGDENRPHVSSARKLATHKVYLGGYSTLQINDKVNYADGFCLKATENRRSFLIMDGAKGLVANAIEIMNIGIGNPILIFTNTPVIITNLLVIDNVNSNSEDKISLANPNLNLVNATIARNDMALDIADSKFVNSAFWNNKENSSLPSELVNCATSSSVNTGFQILLHPDNYGLSNGVMGPSFNLSATNYSSWFKVLLRTKYDHSPLLNSGETNVWTHPTTGITAVYGISKDIDGAPRVSDGVVDVGCHEHPPLGPILTFYANDGTDRVILSVKFGEGRVVVFPPSPTREGYDFKGWFSLAVGGVQYMDNLISMPNQSVNIYAQWKPIAYIAEFNTNGGTPKGGVEEK